MADTELIRPAAAKAPAIPTSRKPAWATDEYPSIRLTSVWAIATSDPSSIVTTETARISGRQSHDAPPNATKSTRMSATTAAALVPAAMNAVTGVGAPW